MISICIPVYNFDVSHLIADLEAQIKSLPGPIEIIVIDDASADSFKKANHAAASRHQYIQLAQNVGRSKIRNQFLAYAKFDYLLFLDCDSQIISTSFIENYANAISSEAAMVCCGGRIYPTENTDRSKMLSWTYGSRRESLSLAVRIQNSNQSFMSNNFMIHRSLLKQTRFDERLTDYGHEDTLFGYMLKQQGVNIKHIDNPILNGDIETNIHFLQKTEKGIENLLYIRNFLNNDSSFIQDVKLLKTAQLLKSLQLKALYRVLFFLTSPFLKWSFTHGWISLYLFDFYKLGFLFSKE